MHRSGTSFVSHFLARIGLDFGPEDDFVSQDQWNADGYFENLDVTLLNDRILLGDTFYREDRWRLPPGELRTSDWLVMNLLKVRYFLDISEARARKRTREKAEEIRALVDRFPGNTAKDPRFCYTLGGWREAIKVDGVLFVFREPEEVINSIRKRVKLPPRLGRILWERHIRSFLSQLGDTPVAVVRFHDFFQEATALPALKTCFAFAGRPFEEGRAHAMLDQVLNRKLRHFTVKTHPKYPAEMQALIDRVLQLGG
jgi:hypothetical protein